MNNSMMANMFAAGMMNPSGMIGQFGGFPVPQADMMGMMPYLYPGLAGFYAAGGMPFMPMPMLPSLCN